MARTRIVDELLAPGWHDLRDAKAALKERDFPCSSCGWKSSSRDLHHRMGRLAPDPHRFDQLVVLCPNCHRMVHEGVLDDSGLEPLDEMMTRMDWGCENG